MYLLFKYLRDTCKNWQSAECLSWAISFIRKKQGDFQPQSDFSGSFHALGLCPGSETEAVCCGKFYGALAGCVSSGMELVPAGWRWTPLGDSVDHVTDSSMCRNFPQSSGTMRRLASWWGFPREKVSLLFFFNRTSQSILAKVKNGRHRFLLQKALPAPRHTTLGYSFVALVSILMTSLPARECKDFCTLTDHLLYSVTHCSSQRLLSSNCVKASSSVTALIPSATLSFRFCLILWHTEITLPWCWLRFLLWFIVLSLLGLLAKMQCDYITEFERSGKKIHAVTAQKKTKPFFF